MGKGMFQRCEIDSRSANRGPHSWGYDEWVKIDITPEQAEAVCLALAHYNAYQATKRWASDIHSRLETLFAKLADK